MFRFKDFLDARIITDLREKESILAAKFLNARYLSLGEVEVPLRYLPADQYTLENFLNKRFGMLGYRRMPPPFSLVEEVSVLLWNALSRLDPDEIWLPLGIAKHFDHRLTRDACLHMIATHWHVFRTKRIILYEDLPYAWEDPQSAQQLTGLLHQNGAKIDRTSIDITNVFDEKIDCLKIYASQWKVSMLRPNIEAAAKQAAVHGKGYGESLWILHDPPKLPLTPLITVRGMSQDQLQKAISLLFKYREKIKQLSLLISHAVGLWSDHAALLLRLFPNARIEVLAFRQNMDQFAGFSNPRLHLTFFHEHPISLIFNVIKWSAHINHTVLIFGGTRRFKEANWLRRALLTQHAYVFETFEDICALWRRLLYEDHSTEAS
jgi:LmbE family N-acetylglucosaminyl deacetylase